MNKKLLCAALLGGLSLAQVANAQVADDRWYLTGSAGMNIQDNDRGTRNAPFGALGVGKFLNDNWSLDGELNYQNPNFDDNQDLNWSQYGISFDARRFFNAEGRNWAPYILMGLGYQESEEEFDRFPDPNSPGERKEGNVAAKVGVGIQSALAGKRAAIRTELAYRADFDDGAPDVGAEALRDESWYGDLLASVGVVIPLGAPVVPPPPAPAAPSCADLDDDGDGVNNCDDKCPDSQAGQTIGPDGCPVPVSIDLKGVNFDFDKATLRPHRPVRQRCVQPEAVGASRHGRVRLPDHQRRGCLAPAGSDRLRREPSAGRQGPEDARVQERAQPPYRAERPELRTQPGTRVVPRYFEARPRAGLFFERVFAFEELQREPFSDTCS
jgi:OmpA-OmpF porin, OOP family